MLAVKDWGVDEYILFEGRPPKSRFFSKPQSWRNNYKFDLMRTFTISSSKLRGHRSRTSSFHSVMRFGAMYDCMNRKTSMVTLTRSKTTILKRKGGYSYLETADGICIFDRSQDSSPAHGRLLCYIILSRNLPGLRPRLGTYWTDGIVISYILRYMEPLWTFSATDYANPGASSMSDNLAFALNNLVPNNPLITDIRPVYRLQRVKAGYSREVGIFWNGYIQ